MELNDVIIPKCAGQRGKCYFSDIKINAKNIDFIHEKHLKYNNDRYQNIIVIDKNIKGLLLREGYGNMEHKKNLKERRTIGKTFV